MDLTRILYTLLKFSFFASFVSLNYETNAKDTDESTEDITSTSGHNKNNATNYTDQLYASLVDKTINKTNEESPPEDTKLDDYSKPFAVHLGFPQSKNSVVIKWFTQNRTNCITIVEPEKSIRNSSVKEELLKDGNIQHTYAANLQKLEDEFKYRITCGKSASTSTFKISNKKALNHANDPTKLAIVPNVFKSDEHELFARLIRELEELDIDGLAVYDGDVNILQNLKAIVTRMPVMIVKETDEKIITVRQKSTTTDSIIHAGPHTGEWYIKLTNKQDCVNDRFNISKEQNFDLIVNFCNQTHDEDFHQSNTPSRVTPSVWIDRKVEGMLPSYGLLTFFNQTNALWQLIEFKDKSILEQLWIRRSSFPASFNQIKEIRPHGLRMPNTSHKETMNVTGTPSVQNSSLKQLKAFKVHSITFSVNTTFSQNDTTKETVVTPKRNNTLHKVLNEINNTFRKLYYPSINRNLPYLGKTDERSFTTGAVITGTVIIVMLGIMVTGLAWLHCYRREKRKKIRRNKKSPKRKPRVQSDLPYERFLDSRQEFDIEQELQDC